MHIRDGWMDARGGESYHTTYPSKKRNGWMDGWRDGYIATVARYEVIRLDRSYSALLVSLEMVGFLHKGVWYR